MTAAKNDREVTIQPVVPVCNLYLSMGRFATKFRQLSTPEDGASPVEYIVGLVLLSLGGYVVYRLLGNGLF